MTRLNMFDFGVSLILAFTAPIALAYLAVSVTS